MVVVKRGKGGGERGIREEEKGGKGGDSLGRNSAFIESPGSLWCC